MRYGTWVAEDLDKLAEELAKARTEGMARGWLVMLTVVLVTVIAVVVAVASYVFIQLF